MQTWLVLIGQAAERRTMTYAQLGHTIFQRRGAGVLAAILGCVAFYCRQNKLPPLNCIVVGQSRGRPGRGIPVTSDAHRERVYRYPWFHLYPPTPDELEEAVVRAAGGRELDRQRRGSTESEGQRTLK